MGNIKYEIWQLPMRSPYKFMHYDWIKTKPIIGDYVIVYAGEIEDGIDVLENIFELLNVDYPPDYHAASLSVSDVICLVTEANQRYWWYVDGKGFKSLGEEFVKI